MTVTCTTVGCDNADIPIDVEVPADTTGWAGVYCGPCGAQLHDPAS